MNIFGAQLRLEIRLRIKKHLSPRDEQRVYYTAEVFYFLQHTNSCIGPNQ